MRPALERDIQLAICDYLALRRYFFWRANTIPAPAKDGGFRAMPKYGMTGVPDIIVVKDGRFIGLEVKRPGGKVSEAQAEFARACMRAGGRYEVVRSVDDVQRVGL